MYEHLLSLVIWIPILMGGAVFTISFYHEALSRWLALGSAAVGVLMALPLFFCFNDQSAQMQFVESMPLLNSQVLRIRYDLGVDGISMLFVVLNSLITLIVLLAEWFSGRPGLGRYFASFLVMSGLINGAFAAMDAMLFYVFFEAMLIPMYLIIGIWGGTNRIYAAVKFFLYTLLGSMLLLVALMYLSWLDGGGFEIASFYELRLSLSVQLLLFGAFFLSFAVKVPMFPLHTWLPDAHVEAPTGGSIVLAAVTLKLGAYGFLRFVLPILPDASRMLAPYLIGLSLIAIVYIGFIALVQEDMKKLIAYSSISHMGMVTLGLFLFSGQYLNSWAVEGAIFQMLSHGFVSAALFLCVGILYGRMHTREIKAYGGVAAVMPKLAAFMMLFAMANAGLPATSGFVGEFMVIMGAVQTNFWVAVIAGLTLVLAAAYTLWMYRKVMFGDIVSDAVAALKDVNRLELSVLLLLALAVVGLGVYPQAVTGKLHQTVNELIAIVAQSKL